MGSFCFINFPILLTPPPRLVCHVSYKKLIRKLSALLKTNRTHASFFFSTYRGLSSFWLFHTRILTSQGRDDAERRERESSNARAEADRKRSEAIAKAAAAVAAAEEAEESRQHAVRKMAEAEKQLELARKSEAEASERAARLESEQLTAVRARDLANEAREEMEAKMEVALKGREVAESAMRQERRQREQAESQQSWGGGRISTHLDTKRWRDGVSQMSEIGFIFCFYAFSLLQ